MERKMDISPNAPLITSTPSDEKKNNIGEHSQLQLGIINLSSRAAWNITIQNNGVSSFEYKKVEPVSSLTGLHEVATVNTVPSVAEPSPQMTGAADGSLQLVLRPRTEPPRLGYYSSSSISNTKICDGFQAQLKSQNKHGKEGQSCEQIGRNDLSDVLEMQIKLVDYRNSDVAEVNLGKANIAPYRTLAINASSTLNTVTRPTILKSGTNYQNNEPYLFPNIIPPVNQNCKTTDSLRQYSLQLPKRNNSHSVHSLRGLPSNNEFHFPSRKVRNSKDGLAARRDLKSNSLADEIERKHYVHDKSKTDKSVSTKKQKIVQISKANTPHVKTKRKRSKACTLEKQTTQEVSKTTSWVDVDKEQSGACQSKRICSKKFQKSSSKNKSRSGLLNRRATKNQIAGQTQPTKKCSTSLTATTNNNLKNNFVANCSSLETSPRNKSQSKSTHPFIQLKGNQVLPNQKVLCIQNHGEENRQNDEELGIANHSSLRVANRCLKEEVPNYLSQRYAEQGQSTSYHLSMDDGVDNKTVKSSWCTASNTQPQFDISISLQPPDDPNRWTDGTCPSKIQNTISYKRKVGSVRNVSTGVSSSDVIPHSSGMKTVQQSNAKQFSTESMSKSGFISNHTSQKLTNTGNSSKQSHRLKKPGRQKTVNKFVTNIPVVQTNIPVRHALINNAEINKVSSGTRNKVSETLKENTPKENIREQSSTNLSENESNVERRRSSKTLPSNRSSRDSQDKSTTRTFSATLANKSFQSQSGLLKRHNISNNTLNDNTSNNRLSTNQPSAEISKDQSKKDKARTLSLNSNLHQKFRNETIKSGPIVIQPASQPVSKYPLSPVFNRQIKQLPKSSSLKEGAFKNKSLTNEELKVKSKSNIVVDSRSSPIDPASSNSFSKPGLSKHFATVNIQTDLPCADKSVLNSSPLLKDPNISNRPSQDQPKKKFPMSGLTASDSNCQQFTTERSFALKENSTSNRMLEDIKPRTAVSYTVSDKKSKDIYGTITTQSLRHRSASYRSSRNIFSSKTRSTASNISAAATSKELESVDAIVSSKRQTSNESINGEFRRDRRDETSLISNKLTSNQSRGDNVIKDCAQASDLIEPKSKCKSKFDSVKTSKIIYEKKGSLQWQPSITTKVDSDTKFQPVSRVCISMRNGSSDNLSQEKLQKDLSNNRRTIDGALNDEERKEIYPKEIVIGQTQKDGHKNQRTSTGRASSSGPSKDVTKKCQTVRRRTRERTVSRHSRGREKSTERTKSVLHKPHTHRRAPPETVVGKANSQSKSVVENKEILTIHRSNKSRFHRKRPFKKQSHTMHDDIQSSTSSFYSTDSEMSHCSFASFIQNRPIERPHAKRKLGGADSLSHIRSRQASGPLLYKDSMVGTVPTKRHTPGLSYPVESHGPKSLLRSIGSTIAKESARGTRVRKLDRTGSAIERVDSENFFQSPRSPSIIGHDLIAPPAPRWVVPAAARAMCLHHLTNSGPPKFNLRLRTPPPCICRHIKRVKKAHEKETPRIIDRPQHVKQSENYALAYHFRPMSYDVPEKRHSNHLKSFLHDLGKSIVPPERYRAVSIRRDGNKNSTVRFSAPLPDSIVTHPHHNSQKNKYQRK